MFWFKVQTTDQLIPVNLGFYILTRIKIMMIVSHTNYYFHMYNKVYHIQLKNLLFRDFLNIFWILTEDIVVVTRSQCHILMNNYPAISVGLHIVSRSRLCLFRGFGFFTAVMSCLYYTEKLLRFDVWFLCKHSVHFRSNSVPYVEAVAYREELSLTSSYREAHQLQHSLWCRITASSTSKQ
jgi:hypothetical protein